MDKLYAVSQAGWSARTALGTEVPDHTFAEDLLGGEGGLREPQLEHLTWSKTAESSGITQKPWGGEEHCPYRSGAGARTARHTNDTLAVSGSSHPPWPCSAPVALWS